MKKTIPLIIILTVILLYILLMRREKIYEPSTTPHGENIALPYDTSNIPNNGKE